MGNLMRSWNRSRGDGPTRRETWPLTSLHQDIDRLFEDFFRGWGLAPFRGLEQDLGTFGPRVEIAEDDKAIRVSAELPGVDEKDVEVSVPDGVLTIQGEKRAEEEQKDKSDYRMERSFGSFHRAFQLPAEADEEHVEASFKKGLLTVTLPKRPQVQQKTKRIEVKSG